MGGVPPSREQKLATTLAVEETVGEVSKSSDAVAAPVLAGSVEASHSMVVSAGQVIGGVVVSCTVINCVQTSVLPAPSAAVQMRVITSGQAPAEVSLNETDGAGSQSSEAVALPVLAG